MYYPGLLIYSLFWMIGKFFVYISCCDCWCKDEYEVDSIMFNKTSNTNSPFVSKESEEERKAKKKLEDLIPDNKKEDYKKAKKNFKSIINKVMKISSKNDS